MLPDIVAIRAREGFPPFQTSKSTFNAPVGWDVAPRKWVSDVSWLTTKPAVAHVLLFCRWGVWQKRRTPLTSKFHLSQRDRKQHRESTIRPRHVQVKRLCTCGSGTRPVVVHQFVGKYVHGSNIVQAWPPEFIAVTVPKYIQGKNNRFEKKNSANLHLHTNHFLFSSKLLVGDVIGMSVPSTISLQSS